MPLPVDPRIELAVQRSYVQIAIADRDELTRQRDAANARVEMLAQLLSLSIEANDRQVRSYLRELAVARREERVQAAREILAVPTDDPQTSAMLRRIAAAIRGDE